MMEMMDDGCGREPDGMFIVLRDGRDISTVGKTHGFLKDASEEAERLVRKEGCSFTVYSLKVEGVCLPAPAPVEWRTPLK